MLPDWDGKTPRTPPPIVVYASRIDLWLAVLMALVFGAVLYEALELHHQLAWGVGALLLLLLRLLVLPCSYTLMPDHLLVRCGVRRWVIPYGEIKSVLPSYSPNMAPALSLRRVEIRYGRHVMLVSPRARQEFLDALKLRARQHHRAR